MQRPDLDNVDPLVLAYIEYLEKKAGIRQTAARNEESAAFTERATELLPAERETTVNIITLSLEGKAKRTYRHLYTRQHRGGMGMFGFETTGDDEPAVLAGAEDHQNLLFFTNQARVFRQSIQTIPPTQVNDRGGIVTERFSLEPDEKVVTILPEQARGYVALVSKGGRVRCLRHHLFGEHMRPGTPMYNTKDFGPLASACWTPGDGELFLITQQGMAIRFSEKAIAPQGDQGIRLAKEDSVIGVTPVYADSNVFIISADGRGTLRQMSGFAPNKSPGGSGKIAIKSTKVVGALSVEMNDDLFAISRLGKVIRFPVSEVPETEGVVQGVNCMGLRGDEVIAIYKSGPIY